MLTRGSAQRRRRTSRAALVAAVAGVGLVVSAAPAFASNHGILPGGELLEVLFGDAAETTPPPSAQPPREPVFAAAGPVELRLPSRHVELVGFHEANHHGARSLRPRDAGVPAVTMASRGRPTGRRTAADIVAAPGQPVLAPVSGRVVRAGSYALYCRHPDHYAVIAPDAHPSWEVKVLHFRGLRVDVGDRVVASRTVLGTGPRTLPVESQVDDFSHPRDWPHVHVEVVDPSVPTPPGRSC